MSTGILVNALRLRRQLVKIRVLIFIRVLTSLVISLLVGVVKSTTDRFTLPLFTQTSAISELNRLALQQVHMVVTTGMMQYLLVTSRFLLVDTIEKYHIYFQMGSHQRCYQ